MMRNRNILVKSLLENGLRIFTISEFKEIAVQLGYAEPSIRQLLLELRKIECIHMIKSGLYHINSNFLGTPISEYEIGLAIAKQGFLSYLSAISLHQLTDQVANIIYITVENDQPYKPRTAHLNDFHYDINGIKYKIITTKKELIFGVEEKWIGESRVKLTDIERTLVDALNKPQYCGGFMEVLNYFEQAASKYDLSKLISYAFRYGNSSLQRLGWCLDKLNVNNNIISLLEINSKTMVKLDVSGARKGKNNNKWNIIENI